MSSYSDYANAVSQLYQQQAQNQIAALQARTQASMGKAQNIGQTIGNLGQLIANIPAQQQARRQQQMQERYQGLQMQNLQGEVDQRQQQTVEKQRQADLAAKFQALGVKHQGQYDQAYFDEARQIDGPTANAIEEAHTKAMKDAADLQKLVTDNTITKQQGVYALAAATDPAKPESWFQFLMGAKRLDPDFDPAAVGTTYNPQYVDFAKKALREKSQINPTPTLVTHPNAEGTGNVQEFIAPQAGQTVASPLPPPPPAITPYQQATLDETAKRDRETAANAAERLKVSAGSGVDADTVTYWVRQVQNDPTQWSMLSNNKPLQQAVQKGLSTAGTDLDKITAQSRGMAEIAKEILPSIARVKQEAAELDQAGLMGPLSGRWRDLAANRIGAQQMFNSPDVARKVGKFITDIGLLETAAARAHGGARGGGSPTMLEHMELLMGPGGKDLPIFLGNLDAVGQWMQGYADMVPGGNTSKSGTGGSIGPYTFTEVP